MTTLSGREGVFELGQAICKEKKGSKGKVGLPHLTLQLFSERGSEKNKT